MPAVPHQVSPSSPSPRSKHDDATHRFLGVKQHHRNNFNRIPRMTKRAPLVAWPYNPRKFRRFYTPEDGGFHKMLDTNVRTMHAMVEVTRSHLVRRGVPNEHIVYVCAMCESACGLILYDKDFMAEVIESTRTMTVQADIPVFRCFAVDGRMTRWLMHILRDSPMLDDDMHTHCASNPAFRRLEV